MQVFSGPGRGNKFGSEEFIAWELAGLKDPGCEEGAVEGSGFEDVEVAYGGLF